MTPHELAEKKYDAERKHDAPSWEFASKEVKDKCIDEAAIIWRQNQDAASLASKPAGSATVQVTGVSMAADANLSPTPTVLSSIKSILTKGKTK